MRRQRLTSWILCLATLAGSALATSWVLRSGDGNTATGAQVTVTGKPPTGRAPAPEREPGAGPLATERPRYRVPSIALLPAMRPHFSIVRLLPGRGVAMSMRPNGAPVTTLEPRTEFGSPVVLSVYSRRGGWIGFETPFLPNGELGWVRFDPSQMKLYWTKYSLHIDLSQRSLEVRYGGRRLSKHLVTVGGVGTETPLGRFAVTDALTFDASPYYGCCALALSGHQTKLPIDWIGGNRLAIHGTPGPVGLAASHGCVRATDETMRKLFSEVPLGAPVFVES